MMALFQTRTRMAPDVIHTTIEGLLASFYIYVLFLIIRSKAKVFKNAFYTIFVATGTADVICLFTTCGVRLSREFALGKELQNMVLCLLVISGTASYAHFIGNMLITINRYSAICLLNRYDSIWTRNKVGAVVAIQYAVSFAASIQIIGAQLVYIPNEDGIPIFTGYERQVDMIVMAVYFGVCLICAVVSIILNARILVEWKRRPKSVDSQKHRLHEKGLLTYAVLMFSCSLFMCTLQVIRVIAVSASLDALNQLVTKQFFWTNDVMLSIPPLFLLLLSSDLRRELVISFRCYKNRNCVNTLATHPNNRFNANKF
ncbi:hypothetical protein V3C99_007029 [Haemonchus contortus]